jgi:hypothetical protein
MLLSSVPDLQPEYEAPYRELSERVLQSVGIYDGSEDRYRELMGALIALEQWMVLTFGKDAHASRLSDEMEGIISAAYTPDQSSHTIGGFMDMARDRLTQLMQPSDESAPPLGELPVLRVQLEQTILPPDSGHKIQAGSGDGLRPPEFAPRLQRLVSLLQEHGVFTDDLVIVTGTNTASMMREQSYNLVEIPRIGKEILVCDQIGEATFVMLRPLGRETYVRSTKEELIQLTGVVRIVWRTGGQWDADVSAALFEREQEMGPKINVADREALRSELHTMSPAAWVAMSYAERRAFEIDGKKMHAIAKAMGYAESPFKNRIAHLELGAFIWGDAEAAIRTVLQTERADLQAQKELGTDRARWISAIQERITQDQLTLDDWLSWNAGQRLAFKVHGIGLIQLAQYLGIEGDPLNNRVVYLELSSVIWPENSDRIATLLQAAREKQREREQVSQQAEQLGTDPQKWAEAMRAAMTVEDWFAAESEGFKFQGKGLYAIGTIFGLETGRGSRLTVTKLREELAMKIWGRIISENEHREHVRAALKGAFTPETWSRLTVQELSGKDIAGTGLGINSIASLFGITGNVRAHATRTRFGQAIWGEEYGNPEDKERERVRNQIMMVHTPETWAQLSGRDCEGKDFAGTGLGIQAVATLFRTGGLPQERTADRIKLGQAIFGEAWNTVRSQS